MLPMNTEQPDPLETLAAIIIGGIIIISLLFSCLGCRTCPPCEPEIVTKEVKVPVRFCEKPEELPTLSVPDFPSPPETLDDDSLRIWYVEMVKAVKVREKILRDRITELEMLLEPYKE